MEVVVEMIMGNVWVRFRVQGAAEPSLRPSDGEVYPRVQSCTQLGIDNDPK